MDAFFSAAQQYLPMPLAGHCVLDVKLGTNRFAMGKLEMLEIKVIN